MRMPISMVRITPPTLFMTFVVACMWTAPAFASIVSDDFNRTTGLGSNWTVLYGSYATNGSTAVSGVPPINGNWARSIVDLGTDDYSVQAEITIPTNSVDSGLFARSQDTLNFDSSLYAFKLNADGSAIIYRRNYWNWTPLASSDAGIAANTTYTMKLVVMGSNPVHLEGWIDGAKVLSVDDDSAAQITTGVAGLVNYQDGVIYDNFEIDTVSSHLFFDYFDRSTSLGSSWNVGYGSFALDGANAVSGAPPINGNWANVAPSVGIDDYAVSADLVIPSGTFDNGVVARSAVPGYFDSDLYAALLATDGNVYLYRRNSWDWTELAEYPAGINPDVSYNLKLTVSGSNPVHLEVWLDGNDVIAHDDTDLNQISSGIPGIMNYDPGVAYADFFVDALTASSNVTVSVDLQGSGAGTVTSSTGGISCPGNCRAVVAKGTPLSFNPAPDANSTFGGWSGACQGKAGCAVTPNNNQTIFAEFDPKFVDEAVIVKGSGSVSSSDSGMNCSGPDTCTEKVAYGATGFTFSAQPATGYLFKGWSGGGCTGTGSCAPSTTASTTVTAEFTTSTPGPWTVSVNVSSHGSVTDANTFSCGSSSSCSLSATDGTSVTLTAHPDTNYGISGWGDDCAFERSSPTCTLSAIHSDKIVSIVFQPLRAYPCGDHPCALGEFPPSTWQPYDSTSMFNKPIPSSPALDPNSSTEVGYLTTTMHRSNHLSHFWYPQDGASGWPTYYGNAGSGYVHDYIDCSWDACKPDPNGTSLYVPIGAEVQDRDPTNANRDRHYTFIDQTTDPIIEYDLWGSSTSPITSANNQPIETLNAGYTYVMSGDGVNFGSGNANGTAANTGNLAGRIRAEELIDAVAAQSYIHHALAITIPCTNGNPGVGAASRAGGVGMRCSDARLNFVDSGNAPTLGARLWLDLDVDQSAYAGIPQWKKVLLRTLNKYGAIVMDTSAGRDMWSFMTESGVQYIVTGADDQWQVFGAARVGESSSDWYYRRVDQCDPGTSQALGTCFPGYTGTLFDDDDSINWMTSVWSHLKVLDSTHY